MIANVCLNHSNKKSINVREYNENLKKCVC